MQRLINLSEQKFHVPKVCVSNEQIIKKLINACYFMFGILKPVPMSNIKTTLQFLISFVSQDKLL